MRKVWLKGFNIRDQVEIPTIQFADDTLILCDGVGERMLDVKAVLSLFELYSGQSINWGKSGVVGINYSSTCESGVAKILGCKPIKLPSSYLGLPFFTGRASKALWQPVVEKYQKRIDSWKGQLLSQAGRVTLIKATLVGIPNYYLSLIPCPVSIVKKIEAMRRKFLWCGSQNHSKYPLVKWANIVKAKEEGGLGIKGIKHMGTVLITKWLWRYTIENDSLWKSLIQDKYNYNSEDWSPSAIPSQPSALWRNVIVEKNRMEKRTKIPC